ncbi:phage holin, lambda family [compost metagenome]
MDRMPDRPESWVWLSAWLEHNWPALYAGLLSAAIAALRIMYGGGTLRRLALEAPLCGLVTTAGTYGLPLAGIPPTAAPFLGGVVALLGIEWVRARARRTLERKVEQL